MKKTNRTFKRFAAITSASLLAACMVAPMATGMTSSAYNITITSNGNIDASKHTFSAYQLFTGTLNDDETGFVGGTVEWGSALNTDDLRMSFIDKIKNKTFANTEAEAAINALTASMTDGAGNTQSTAYEVALALEKLAGASDADKNLLAEAISAVALADAENSVDGTISDLDAGYYFVKDTTTIGQGDAASRFILKLTGDEEVQIKTDAPTLEKKIWHNDVTANPTISTESAPTFETDVLANNGWVDVGDNQIGDTIYYVTKTSVPDMSDYDTYKYIINDTMDSGLTVGDVTNIVYVPSSGSASEISFVTTGDTAQTALVTKSANGFTVDFGDLKTVLPNANGGYIYTYYTATLNANAEVSASANDKQNNPNEAWLEYSNNPNVSGSGESGDENETGTTAKDIVYDWTYTFNASKVDEKGAPLAGATFELRVGGTETAIELIEITDVSKIEGIESAAEDTKYFRIATEDDKENTPDKVVTSFTSEEVEGVIKNKFVFVGLDDTKRYDLQETSAPDNYNKATEPSKLIIANSYKDADEATVDTGDEVFTISRTVDGTASNNAEIVNRKGASLPGTGGIGTTIFYLGGGAMAAIGGVYLISKRRMKKSEE